MIRREASRDPIAAFPLPVAVPPSVKPFAENFERLGKAWGACKGEIQDAEHELVVAEAEEIRATAAALAGGKEPKPSTRIPDREAKLKALRDRFAALSVAVDVAGNELADAIAAARDEWIASFDPKIADATKCLREGLATAREALDVLGHAKAGRVWLGDFDPGQAHVGLQQRFHGGSTPFRVKRPPSFSNEPTVGDLLEIAEGAFAEIEGMVAVHA